MSIQDDKTPWTNGYAEMREERDKAVKVADAMREIVEESRASKRLRPRNESPPEEGALCLYSNGEKQWWKIDYWFPPCSEWLEETMGKDGKVVGWLPLPPTDLEVQE